MKREELKKMNEWDENLRMGPNEKRSGVVWKCVSLSECAFLHPMVQALHVLTQPVR